MRTETITRNIYQFSELSEQAKEEAIQKFHQDRDLDWIEEIRDSFKSVCELLEVRISSTGNYYSNGFDANINLMTGLRLRTWLINNILPEIEKPKYLGQAKGKPVYSKMSKEISCPFTGCCYDMDFLGPIIDYIKYDQYYRDNDGRICLDSLCNELFRTFDKLVDLERENQQSEECFAGLCEANGYEFDEQGNLL